MRIETMKNQLESLSVKSALLCIIQKGCHSHFWWGGEMWSANRALIAWEGDLLNMPCGSFGVVSFFGGPPGKCRWHNGTILTMLCDLLLFEENTKELSETAKLSL